MLSGGCCCWCVCFSPILMQLDGRDTALVWSTEYFPQTHYLAKTHQVLAGTFSMMLWGWPSISPNWTDWLCDSFSCRSWDRYQVWSALAVITVNLGLSAKAQTIRSQGIASCTLFSDTKKLLLDLIDLFPSRQNTAVRTVCFSSRQSVELQSVTSLQVK